MRTLTKSLLFALPAGPAVFYYVGEPIARSADSTGAGIAVGLSAALITVLGLGLWIWLMVENKVLVLASRQRTEAARRFGLVAGVLFGAPLCCAGICRRAGGTAGRSQAGSRRVHPGARQKHCGQYFGHFPT